MLRNGDRCRSVATHDEFCAYHAALADELGEEVVANGDRRSGTRDSVFPWSPRRNSRAQPDGLEVSVGRSTGSRPRRRRRARDDSPLLLEAATSTTRETWATCTCPECGKGFRQEISVPDHGARIKAIETLLREGLGRVGEAEVVEPRMPPTAEEVKNLSDDELHLVFALSHAKEIRAVVDDGDDALRSEVESWTPKARASLARVLAEVG